MTQIQRQEIEAKGRGVATRQAAPRFSPAPAGFRVACWISAVVFVAFSGLFLQGCAREASAEGNVSSSGDGTSNPVGNGPTSPEDPPAPPPEENPAPPPPGGPVTLQLGWDAPTQSADGTTLRDLSGYRIYQGSVAGRYDVVQDIGKVTSFETQPLTPGTYYFALIALDGSGNESDFSNVASVTIE